MSTTIWTKRLLAASAERAIKATAWAAVVVSPCIRAGLIDADWLGASVAGMAGVLSHSAPSRPTPPPAAGPSITNAEILTDGKR